jgi:uncharacterized protein DUF3592
MNKPPPVKTIILAIIIIPLFILGGILFFYIPGLITYFANTGVAGYFVYLFSFFFITQCFMLKRSYKSVNWPTTNGTVTESRVSHDGEHYSAKVRYQYTVNDR